MAFQPTKKELHEFLNTQKLCVISTLNESGAPQGATVAFSQTHELQFIVGTDVTSRKSQNMQREPRVAITITDPSVRYTVQTEGNARLLSDEEFTQYSEHLFAKNPNSRKFKNIQGQVYFLITPHTIRFSDCNVFPYFVTEIPTGTK